MIALGRMAGMKQFSVQLRFTIRDLILVTIIVALAVGWWLDRDTIRQAREKHYKAIEDIAERDKKDKEFWRARSAKAEAPK
jgi:hypothetical protein